VFPFSFQIVGGHLRTTFFLRGSLFMWVEAILTGVISEVASFVTLQQPEEANFAG
jgi:hypothetical protein